MIGGLLRLLSESVRSLILRRVATFGYTDIVPAHLAVFQFPSPDGAMRRAVTEVEVEWERLLGKSQFAEMRDALMDLRGQRPRQ